jgi:hypothetical protein
MQESAILDRKVITYVCVRATGSSVGTLARNGACILVVQAFFPRWWPWLRLVSAAWLIPALRNAVGAPKQPQHVHVVSWIQQPKGYRLSLHVFVVNQGVSY